MYDPDEVAEAPILGQATEQYNEWLGTIALDDPHDSASPLDPLYALSGVDQEMWTIIGVSMAGGRIGIDELYSAASVYAVSRELVPTFEAFDEVAAQFKGRIPVTQFTVDVDQAGLRLLDNVFKRWTIHALIGGIARDYDLAIVDSREPDE